MKPIERHTNGYFKKGSGGRQLGQRNKLQGDFIAALAKHWGEVGNKAIDIVFKENPKEYLKIVASILPKEYLVSEGEIDQMTDDDLNEALAIVRQMKAAREATQQ